MRILLDESLPIELQSELPDHDTRTVQAMGWSGLKNGELLARAADLFEVFLTVDQNLPHQQNLRKLPYFPSGRDDERPPHVVVFVLCDMAVIDVALRSGHAGGQLEPGADGGEVTGLAFDRILEAQE